MGKSVWPLIVINLVEDFLSARAEKRSAKIINEIRANNVRQARRILSFPIDNEKAGRDERFLIHRKTETAFSTPPRQGAGHIRKSRKLQRSERCRLCPVRKSQKALLGNGLPGLCNAFQNSRAPGHDDPAV